MPPSTSFLGAASLSNSFHFCCRASRSRNTSVTVASCVHGLLRAVDDSQHLHSYRTIWLSDIHLGSPGCQALYLLEFLRVHRTDTLYLVGDILDGWQLRKTWYWPQEHNDVVQKLLRMARKGTRVVYVPGNHDEMSRQFIGLSFGGIQITEEAVYVSAPGERTL